MPGGGIPGAHIRVEKGEKYSGIDLLLLLLQNPLSLARGGMTDIIAFDKSASLQIHYYYNLNGGGEVQIFFSISGN